VIASPVGVNSEIVTPENGLLAADGEAWQSGLRALLADSQLRARMGAAGRERAVRQYSLTSQAPRLIELFQSVAATAGSR
jgi:glycosyltransferase involved in cell wall biosynthesis